MTTFMNNLPELILQDWISPSANSSWCSSERKTCKSIKKREEKIFENPINIHYPNRLNIDTNLINRIFFFSILNRINYLYSPNYLCWNWAFQTKQLQKWEYRLNWLFSSHNIIHFSLFQKKDICRMWFVVALFEVSNFLTNITRNHWTINI